MGARTEVALYALDPASGTLIERTRFSLGIRTAYLDASADGRFFYAGNGAPPGHVVTFSLDRSAGQLERLNQVSTAGLEPALGISHVQLHPTGRWLLSAHLGSGRVSVLPVGADGRIGAPSDTRILAKGAHQVTIDAAGKHAFIPVRDGQFVASFAIDAAAGRLTPLDPPQVPSAPGSGPRHMALHPSQRFAYVNNESNGTVTAYRYHAPSGRLEPMNTVSSVPPDFSETGSSHIECHPSGKFLYVSNRFHNSIAAFAIDAATGQLSLVEIEQAAGAIVFPRDFDLTPDGARMVVGNEKADSLLVLAVDLLTGALAPLKSPVRSPTAPQVIVVVP